MNKILIAGCALFATSIGSAQQKEGKVVYERTVQMTVNFAGMNEEMQRMIPKSRTDKFELTFGNNQSLYKAAETDNEDDGTFSSDNGGVQIRMVAQGTNDMMYSNFETSKRVEQREMFDKKFIIDDSIRSLKWKMTGETKTILNHNCMKAVATQIRTRPQPIMVDGKMERKDVTDTTEITAWFATDIPVSAGPGEFQGQLPGLVLEVDAGRLVYKALSVSDKADLSIIKEPTGKKKYTQAEFRTETEKMVEEMQKNNGGGRRMIRMN
jgi:GLPGLI family protein